MDQIKILIERYPVLAVCEDTLRAACAAIISCYETGGKVLVCGNGGSCADADHIVGELMKGFCKRRPLGLELRQKLSDVGGELGAQMAGKLQSPLRAINLCTHAALATAFSNDVDPHLVYAQLALGYADQSDILLGISTSGNAANVRSAAIAAKARGAVAIGLCGANSCKMDGLFDHVIHVPEVETYRVQELHLPVYHALCLAVEEHFFVD